MLANDSIAPDAGETLSISAVTQGANGTVAITGGGTGLTYTPNANFFGADSFTYTIADGNGGSATATVTVTVNNVNDPPVANNDAATVNEDSGANAIAVLANDSIAPDAGETLSISAVTQGANGTVAITGGGTGLTYTPNANFFGADSFTYTIADGNGGSATATVTVTVNNVNDPPVANNDAATVNEDSGANAIAVLANDSIAPDAGETLSISAVTQGANGTVAITGGGTGLTYTPNANFFGADSFTYTIADGNGGSATATVTVTVNNVNDPPVANNNAFTINDGATLAIAAANLSATDIDNATGTLVFTIGGITHGYFELVSAPGVAITTFTQQQILNGEVRFVHDGSNLAPTFSISVSDGGTGVGPYAANIFFNLGGFTPPPPPPGGGGGPTTVTPPVVVPPTATEPPSGPPGAGGQGGLRSPARLAGGGESEEVGAVIVSQSAPGAAVAKLLAAEAETLPIRAQAEILETTPRHTEIAVEPIRAEMQVLPSSSCARSGRRREAARPGHHGFDQDHRSCPLGGRGVVGGARRGADRELGRVRPGVASP